MATILSFVQRPGAATRQPPVGGEASIIFFTGVRYERDAQRPTGERSDGPTGSNATGRSLAGKQL